MIGGGLLGLEAANGLMQRGMEVTVVHLLAWLMERQLDAVAGGAAAEVARRARADVPDAGADRRRSSAKDRVTGVRFKDGTRAPGRPGRDGGRHPPQHRAREEGGLHCDRGIVVNDTMQTYDPRIYAVGECVQHRGIAYGLVAPLFEQAKVCANHLAQFGIGRYPGSVTSTKLKVTGIDLFSAGDFTGGDGHRGDRAAGRRRAASTRSS